MVLTFGLFFLQFLRFFLFLPFFSRFFPFFIKLILQIYHQEFGTYCLGLVSLYVVGYKKGF